MNDRSPQRRDFCVVSAAFLSVALNFAPAQTQQSLIDFADHQGYISLFDGKTLAGWDGQPGLWRVEDGAIVGETVKGMFVSYAFPNTFLINRGVTAKDFDLKLEIKVEKGGGSGIQYRSSIGTQPGQPPGKANEGRDPRWSMIGPQADFWFPVNPLHASYSGQFYSENTPLGIVAWRVEPAHRRRREDGRRPARWPAPLRMGGHR